MHFIVVVLLIITDQLSKLWVVKTLSYGERNPLGLGFNLTYTQNTGAAFGIFQNNTLILGGLSALVSVFLIVYLVKQVKQLHMLQLTALTLILAGAIGNMIDRFRLGYVIDFIDFYLPSINFDFAVFNVADSCVVIGAGLLLISNFRSSKPVTAQSPDQLNTTTSDTTSDTVSTTANEIPASTSSENPQANDENINSVKQS